MFLGTLCTWFVPETKGMTLESLNDESLPPHFDEEGAERPKDVAVTE